MGSDLIDGTSLIEDHADVTPWYRLTTSDLTGSATAGSSGALGGTITQQDSRIRVAGTPAAVLANGGGEMTRQQFRAPWPMEFGDLVEVRVSSVMASAASSWQLGVMLSGTTPGTHGTLQVGCYGATSIGVNIGSDNASTELTESATLKEGIGVMQTSETGAVCSVMAEAVTTGGALVDANARRSVAYTVDALTLYLVWGTVNTSQNAGNVSAIFDVRRVRKGAAA